MAVYVYLNRIFFSFCFFLHHHHHRLFSFSSLSFAYCYSVAVLFWWSSPFSNLFVRVDSAFSSSLSLFCLSGCQRFILFIRIENSSVGNMIVWLILLTQPVQTQRGADTTERLSYRTTNSIKLIRKRWQRLRRQPVMELFPVPVSDQIDFFSFGSGERRGSISLANSDVSGGHAPARQRRMSTSKVVDNRPKHLILGDFELANVVWVRRWTKDENSSFWNVV